MSDAWGSGSTERTEVTLPQYAPPARQQSNRDERGKWIVFSTLLGVVAFGVGYWVAPNSPSELNQVRNCAGLADTGGYHVRITNASGSVVLNATCNWEGATPK